MYLIAIAYGEITERCVHVSEYFWFSKPGNLKLDVCGCLWDSVEGRGKREGMGIN